jgi:hypothetical protein
MSESLLSDRDDDGKEIEEMMDCDCFDNMMDANYETFNPVDVAKLQTHHYLLQQQILSSSYLSTALWV